MAGVDRSGRVWLGVDRLALEWNGTAGEARQGE